MNFYELIILSAALSADAFAVSLCKGVSMRKINIVHTLAISISFGFFQALMPAVGWVIGSRFERYIVNIDHWISFFLLGYLGIRMIKEARQNTADIGKKKENLLNLNELLVLSVATSIDALAAGITFACLKVDIVRAVTLIGSLTFVFCYIGVIIGNKVGIKYKSKAEITGGGVLIFMAVKILFEHLDIF